MPNHYYNNQHTLNKHELAKGSDVENKLDGVEAGFDKLPSPKDFATILTPYVTTIFSNNEYSVILPEVTGYTDGMTVNAKLDASNTGAVTLNVNGLGGIALLQPNFDILQPNDLTQDSILECRYNGTVFVITSGIPGIIIQAEDKALDAKSWASEPVNTNVKTYVAGVPSVIPNARSSLHFSSQSEEWADSTSPITDNNGAPLVPEKRSSRYHAVLSGNKSAESQRNAWKSEARMMTANSWAVEPHGDRVQVYTSDGLGGFPHTDAQPSPQYSSLHWKTETKLNNGGIQAAYWDALAAQYTAESWASQPVGQPVQIFTSDGLGGFPHTDAQPSPQHSALHWSTVGNYINMVSKVITNRQTMDGELELPDAILSAIDEVINTNTVVDVFIYNTSLDDDGGKWNNSGFSKLAIITLEANLLSIYDANGDMSTPFKTIVTAGATCVSASMGKIGIGTGAGFKTYDIKLNYLEKNWSTKIVNPVVNDVAVTGERWAVYTNGGISIIHPDGLVSNENTPDKQVSGYLSIELVSVNEADGSVDIWRSIPTTNGVAPEKKLTTSSTPSVLGVPGVVTKIDTDDYAFAVGGVSGLTLVSKDLSTSVKITTTSNSSGGGFLKGASNSIQALDYDESTGLLTVCSADHTTVFDGLRVASDEAVISTSISTVSGKEVVGS